MRIAINGMLLRLPYSGVEVAISNLIESVASQAQDWEFFVPVPPGFRPGADVPDNVFFRYAPFGTRQRPGRILWEQLALPKVLHREGVRLLHGPGYVMPLRWRGPTVVSVYDLLVLTHPEWCRLPNVWHYRLLMPRSVRRADRVIVPSAQVRNELVALLGVAPGKIRVVPLGIDPVFRRIEDEPVLQEVRTRHGLPKEYVLVVGNITARKNIPGTVGIFEQVGPHVPHDLALVGGKPHKHRDILRRIAHSPLRERIHMPGYVSAEDLAALYSGAGACLHLAHYEGFGLTPLEAMACGTPAVVSSGGALPEVAGPGGLIVNPDDKEECAQVVVRVLTDLDYRAELIARGQAHAASFTWSATAAQVIPVYEEVLAEFG